MCHIHVNDLLLCQIGGRVEPRRAGAFCIPSSNMGSVTQQAFDNYFLNYFQLSD
jgi:hypothetical protein